MKTIFISYSHKDAKDKDRLMTHLGALEKQGQIVLWDDEKIKVGDDWQAEIEKALNEARAAVLLVSADFLDSDFIINKEVPILLERRAKQGLRIMPVIIGHCAWQTVQWLNEIQAINITCSESGIFQRGLSKLGGYFGKISEKDKAFAEVAKKIHEALDPDLTTPANPIRKSLAAERKGAAINTALSIFIEIKKENGQYTGQIYQANKEKAFELSGMNLGRQVKALPDIAWTLEDLTQAIIGFKPADLKAFDERLQVDLGQYLYDQTLGQLPEEIQYGFLRARVSQVRIISQDEWILRLPWNLLAHQGIFLCAAGWSVSVSAKMESCECLLPRSPRLLIIAPEPAGVSGTGAKDHLEELEDMLSSHDQLLSFGNNLQVVYTWEAFVQKVREFQPELVASFIFQFTN